jgi:signal transduction histidine kinase
MTLIKYLKSKAIIIIIKFLAMINFTVFGYAYGLNKEFIHTIVLVFILQEIVSLSICYSKKRKFFKKTEDMLNSLDEKYLVTELLEETDYYEGKIFSEWIYDIDKSMCDHVSYYERVVKEYKEFIEMWVHEVKIPLASAVIMCKNGLNSDNTIDEMTNYKKISKQLKKIDTYLEQVLYYTRSEHKESDYIFGRCKLREIIKAVALNNKDDLLEKDISLSVDVNDIEVLTDKKWLIFIINQIVNNSIKYSDELKNDSYIKITAIDGKDLIRLEIEDNGIGIDKKDLSNVFKKCFTGENGRVFNKSTGIGLYIVKKLITSLGHKIEIESVKHEYTKVILYFGKNQYMNITNL